MHEPAQLSGSGEAQAALEHPLGARHIYRLQPPTPEIEPQVAIPLPNDAAGRSVFGSIEIDGVNGLVYVRQPTSGVVWWERAKWFSPDVALFAIPIAALVLVLAIRRLVRSPQVRGRRYCAACNYDLTPADGGGVPPELCPECGVDSVARPARLGRTAMRRFGLAIGIAGVVLVGGVFALVTRVERPVPGTFNLDAWPIPILGKHVQALRFLKVEPEFGRGFRLDAYSITTGERVATVSEHSWANFQDMVLTADGTFVAFSIFTLGNNGGYELRFARVVSGVPQSAVRVDIAPNAMPNAVVVSLSPVAFSRPLADGSRWLYIARSTMPTGGNSVRFTAELVRVRIGEGDVAGEAEPVAMSEPLIYFERQFVRSAPYHRWLVREEDGPDPELAKVRVALFIDQPPSAQATGAGTATVTRDAEVVGFPVTTSQQISRAGAAMTGRAFSVSYAGTSFYPPRLGWERDVLAFEPHMSAMTVTVDLSTGAATQTPLGITGPLLSVGPKGWVATGGRAVIGSSGVTLATFGSKGGFVSPTAVSADGRWAAGFSNTLSGQGWWNQIGIGPWMRGEVLVWDLAGVGTGEQGVGTGQGNEERDLSTKE